MTTTTKQASNNNPKKGFLLDTNVVSEVCKKEPNGSVLNWLDQNANDLYLSVVTIEEMRFGQLMMAKGKRRTALKQMIDSLLETYATKMLSFDPHAAAQCAILHEQAISSGYSPSIEDLMIASIAHVNDLVVVTRNTRDFDYLGIELLDPFAL